MYPCGFYVALNIIQISEILRYEVGNMHDMNLPYYIALLIPSLLKVGGHIPHIINNGLAAVKLMRETNTEVVVAPTNFLCNVVISQPRAGGQA